MSATGLSGPSWENLEHPARHMNKEGKMMLDQRVVGFVMVNKKGKTKRRQFPLKCLVHFRTKIAPPTLILSVMLPQTPMATEFNFEFLGSPEETDLRIAQWKGALSAVIEHNRPPDPEAEKRRKAEEARKAGRAGWVAELKRRPSILVERAEAEKEARRRASLLASDLHLFEQYKALVQESRTITDDEFWASRARALQNQDTKPSAQDAGAAGSGLRHGVIAAPVGEQETDKTVRVVVTLDDMVRRFFKYPAVHRAWVELVPKRMSEKEFWTTFEKSKYFHDESNGAGARDASSSSDATKLFENYELRGLDADGAVSTAAERMSRVDPRNDMMLSENATFYAKEDLQALLRDRKGDSREDIERENKRKSLGKRLSDLNRYGSLILSASELKSRALNQLKDSGSAQPLRARTALAKASLGALAQEMKLRELEARNSERPAPLRIDSTARRAAEPASRTPVSSSDQPQVEGQDVAAGVVAMARGLRQGEFLLAPPTHASMGGFETMKYSTSRARGDALAGNMMTGSAGTGDNLYIFSSSNSFKDTRVSPNIAANVRRLCANTAEKLRFYWSCVPPNTKAKVRKARKFYKALQESENELRAYAERLGDRQSVLLQPSLNAIKKATETQSIIESRIREHQRRMRTNAAMADGQPQRKRARVAGAV